jgi:hypothetical protein
MELRKPGWGGCERPCTADLKAAAETGKSADESKIDESDDSVGEVNDAHYENEVDTYC